MRQIFIYSNRTHLLICKLHPTWTSETFNTKVPLDVKLCVRGIYLEKILQETLKLSKLMDF